MSKEQSGPPPPYTGVAPYPQQPPHAPPPQYNTPGPDQPQAPLQSQYYAWPGYPSSNQPGVGYGQPYPIQQTGYSQGTTVVVTQPAVTVIQVFRESPVHTSCPHCRAEVVTAIEYETGTFTWVICCVLWFVGCGFGCCLIPFCLDGCKDVIHSCPNCRQQIARFSRM